MLPICRLWATGQTCFPTAAIPTPPPRKLSLIHISSGSDRAFEQLMQTRPGADHFDSGEAGAPEDCGTCRFYRPHWKYQFCVYEECPYQPGKLTALDGAVKFQVKGVGDEMAVFRVEKNRGYTVRCV